jgi:hypothetical protein
LTRLIRPAAAFAILITVVFGVACGGKDDASDANGGASTIPGPPIPGSVTETAGSPGATGSTGAEATADSTDPTVTPGSGRGLPTADSLNALPSYRYQLTLEGKGSIAESLAITGMTGAGGSDSFKYTIKGAWIAPDKAQVEMEFAGRSVKQTIIGEQQWVTIAGLTGNPLPADSDAAELTYGAAFISQQIVDAALRDFDCTATEQVEGIATVRCEGDIDDFNRTQDQFGSLFDGTTVSEVTAFKSTLWIAEDGGYPVKAELQLGGKTTDGKDFSLAIALNVTDIGQVAEITP